MSDSIFISLILNIGLLVLVATVLTKVPVIRHMLLNERNTFWSRLSLAVIFGSVSILSTYTGAGVQGAIVNTRVIGVIAAGLLGGPSVGVIAAIIAGTHRYLFDIGGFTAVSCALSTFVEGMLGALFSKYFHRGKWDSISIFCLTAAAEICQMLIILLIAKPYADALALVKIIAAPMIILNSIGMVVFIGTFNVVFVEEDNESANKMRLSFQIVEQCLPHLKHGLQSKSDMEDTVRIIFQSIKCSCAMITDCKQILALQVNPKEASAFPMPELPRPALESIEQRQVILYTWEQEDEMLQGILKNHVIIAAPLIEMEQPVGSLLIVMKKQFHSPHANVSFMQDLARLFSTQLELSDLEYQRRLRKKAEYRALQSQVNPHFLYNALNTIASVCREDSDRARELLRVLATYYRQTLECERFAISLHTELYHVSNYLELEKARFEEKLQVDIQVPENIHCMVPAFILQPLVENAVRHGADKQGCRHVRIYACEEPSGIRIHVADKGTGVKEEVISQLYSGEENDKCIGLTNVHKRLLSIYGDENGLDIHASPEGSDISFLIPYLNNGEFWSENTEAKGEIYENSSC